MSKRHNLSFSEIVWRQFRRDRAAAVALWCMALAFLLAVFAPVVASNQPFVFWEDDGRAIYPWFRALFAYDEPVNCLFNMALVAFIPWLVVAFVQWRRWKIHKVPSRTRLKRFVRTYLALTVGLTALFAVPQLRPSQLYASRDFAAEAFESPGINRVLYPPIPFGPTEQNLTAVFKPPLYRVPVEDRTRTNEAQPHLLGTDNTGRDVLVLMIYGSRISLTVGFLAVGLYLAIGAVVGAVAGYFGGFVDLTISRVIEVVLLFPSFFLILTLVALLGPSIYIIMFVIGITGWPTVARLIRAEVLRQRALDYVAAARACGASHARIVFRHLLPNSLGPALVAAPFGVAGAVMTEAGLSLLGFGVRPPTPSWGTLLQLGSANYNYWWLIVVPSLAILAIVTIFNLVGNGLRDAMDPKLRR
jgi:peptide/nickel transport system permease protein